MCYTTRHDYGLEKMPDSPLTSGTTQSERGSIWSEMEQLFDNVIAPNMEFRHATSSQFD